MKNIKHIICIMIVCFLIGLTVSRNSLWSSPLLIWSDTVVKSPRKSRVHNNVGMSYVLIQKRHAAIDAFRRALLIDGYMPAGYNLALQLDTLGIQRDEALHYYDAFCQYAPPNDLDRKRACLRAREMRETGTMKRERTVSP